MKIEVLLQERALMFPKKYKGKNVIWESKKLQYLHSGASLFFVFCTLVSKENIPPLAFWVCLSCFGGLSSFILIRLFRPNNMFVSLFDSGMVMEIIKEEIMKARCEFGLFTYHADGFSYKLHEEGSMYKWTAIETVMAYNTQKHLTEIVYLDIFFAENYVLNITQETPGWYQFIQRLEEQLPAVPASWLKAIRTSAVSTNLTLLYDGKGREFSEIVAALYETEVGEG